MSKHLRRRAHPLQIAFTFVVVSAVLAAATAAAADRNTIISTDGRPSCECVPFNSCATADDVQASSSRTDNCNQNQVCCNKRHIVGGTVEKSNDRSCGVGMAPPDEIDVRINLNTEDGSKTHVGQFPWMVAILNTYFDSFGTKTNDFLYQCGGSLIHPRVVLTAAHCIKQMDLNLLKVRVGEWDTTIRHDNQEYTFQDISVEEVVTHPLFNNRSLHNDVALIKLSSAVKLHRHINTICIPDNEKQENYNSSSCVVTGWGKNAFGGRYQSTLKSVDLPLVPNDVCQEQLQHTRLGGNFMLDKSFICAGGIVGKDSCVGDGGGPLICAVKGDTSNVKKYIQVGIVSWGIKCGEQNVPGVYSSVSTNLQWINQWFDTFTN